MKFKEGEAIFAFDNGNIYEAKILKSQSAGSICKYFIHFQGWDRKYDIWIDETLIAKKNAAADLERLKAQTNVIIIKQKKGNLSSTSSILSTALPSVTMPNESLESESIENKLSQEDAKLVAHDKRKRKGGAEYGVNVPVGKRRLIIDEKEIKKYRKSIAASDMIDLNDEDDGLSVESKLQIPFSLKKHLVDEWSLITQDPKRLLLLPRNISVETIILEFLEFKRKKIDDDQYAKYNELFEGLKLYFDKCLATILLFRYERSQYHMLAEGYGAAFVPSKIYGAEHLLRLFVRLPRLMTQCFLKTNDLSSLQGRLTEFLK